jgi:hypothetical protein
MKNSFSLYGFFCLFLVLISCEDKLEDTIPASFLKIILNPDEIYIYSGGPTYGVRLDPL